MSERARGTVAVVGAGVSGMLAAYELERAGFSVRVIARGPDPRCAASTYHAATYDGLCARLITRYEGHPYLGASALYADMAGAFATPVSEGGWLGKSARAATVDERHWLERRRLASDDPVARKRADRWYEAAADQVLPRWRDLMAAVPELVHEASFHRDGVVRVFDGHDACDAAAAVEPHGARLSAAEVSERWPALAEACAAGRIVGGLAIDGFAVDIQRLLDNLRYRLERADVAFEWNTEVVALQRDGRGDVVALATRDGMIEASSFALLPGAYDAGGMLRGTAAAGRVAGVAGRWLAVPMPAPPIGPLKLHRDARRESGVDYPEVDINVIPIRGSDGEHFLAVGGGYAWAGCAPYARIDEQLAVIDGENERAVATLFGATWERWRAKGRVDRRGATCMRAFTDDDMPIELTLPTSRGGVLTIDVGTNTGTTALAPYIAQRIVARLLERG